MIECPAEAKFEDLSMHLTVFGIGRSSNDDQFWIYPREINSSVYSNHSLMVKGELKDIVLYYSEIFKDFGFRITSLKCFKRLVHLFDTITNSHSVSINGSEKLEVELIGEILMASKDSSKRWLPIFGWRINPFWNPLWLLSGWPIWG